MRKTLNRWAMRQTQSNPSIQIKIKWMAKKKKVMHCISLEFGKPICEYLFYGKRPAIELLLWHRTHCDSSSIKLWPNSLPLTSLINLCSIQFARNTHTQEIFGGKIYSVEQKLWSFFRVRLRVPLTLCVDINRTQALTKIICDLCEFCVLFFRRAPVWFIVINNDFF